MRQHILAVAVRSGLHGGHPVLYDVLVALHVSFALVGFSTVALSGAYGVIGRKGYSSELRRYFDGRNWAELALLLAPLFGIAAMSVRPGGAEYTQVWAISGLIVWLLAGMLLLGLVRPTERKLRAAVLDCPTSKVPTSKVPTSKVRSSDGPAGGPAGGGLIRVYANRLAWAAAISDMLFLVALLMMVTQPR